MLKPLELDSDHPYGPWSCRASDVWDVLRAAEQGDVSALREVLSRDGNLYRAEYWYTQPLELAAREGHAAAVQILLEAGADAGAIRVEGLELVTVARERGHEEVVRLLEVATAGAGARGKPGPVGDPAVHVAAGAGDTARVRALIEADPAAVNARDAAGGTPLHRAVAAAAPDVVVLLLERGADPHAVHAAGRGSERGYPPVDFQPIDLALWTGPFWNVRGDLEMARLLLGHGAEYDLTIAAALGDRPRVAELIGEGVVLAAASRPSGKRPLSTAVQFGHEDIVRELLAAGADPNWPEGSTAPRGVSLHAAARAGNRGLVELLLGHGADPNGWIDSSGSAAYAAATPAIRTLLLERGSVLDAYDLIWLDEDAAAVRLVEADPAAADRGCGGALAAACKLGKKDLVVRLLAAGARVPPIVTACRSYLWSDPETLRLLLESGMSPDVPDWHAATPLHDLCARDGRGRARPRRVECAELLLDWGADVSARDDAYRSTPLAWAARTDLPDMAELLLSRGASAEPNGGPPWSAPAAWAHARGSERVADLLRRAGARI